MNGEWCYFNHYFDKETCEKIIADAADIPTQDGILGIGEGQTVDFSMRRSKIRFVNSDNPKFTWLFDKLWKTALEANRDFFNVHITRLPFIQIAEYDYQDKGEYKEHHDVFWLNNDPIYHRKLSCIVQLSDPEDYQGGDFEITEGCPALDKETKNQGSVIYFPSMFRHKANPVLRGTRYSIAAWFEGPKWR
jgi:PKHD-type hydroxylase